MLSYKKTPVFYLGDYTVVRPKKKVKTAAVKCQCFSLLLVPYPCSLIFQSSNHMNYKLSAKKGGFIEEFL